MTLEEHAKSLELRHLYEIRDAWVKAANDPAYPVDITGTAPYIISTIDAEIERRQQPDSSRQGAQS